jgi:2,3-bisphosphoglycerate-independent phosphoglycerate mutase
MAATPFHPRRPVLLIILDGFGTNPSRLNNGIALARTPNFDRYFSRHPHTLVQASGRAVGLPDGQMGNSEVGHLILGCGSVVRQDFVHIDDRIADGSFFTNAALCAAVDAARARNRPLHLIGLVSDGGVHSHVRHLLALLDLCRRHGATAVLHMITDGRDTPPKCAAQFLPDVLVGLQRVGGRIATVCGRYYAMDRDNRWDRVQAAWNAMVLGVGRRAPDAQSAIDMAYAEGEGDEFIKPTVIDGAEKVAPGDVAVFFNFRKDRPRQLTAALTKKDFSDFDRGGFRPIVVTCMNQYDKWFDLPYAFERERPDVTLGEIISKAGLKQFHCAETEKYPHVTYFFNGGRGDAFPGEDRVIIDSPKVATYDLQPEMSAPQVADAVVEALRGRQYAFLVVNFANGDMVGHTAVPEAIIKTVETLDREVGRVLDVATAEGYSVVLTADHGNCEEMVDPVTGAPHTQHTVYPVPSLVIDQTPWQLSIGAGLSSIAPTVLQLMGLQQPATMHGQSLLLKPLAASAA